MLLCLAVGPRILWNYGGLKTIINMGAIGYYRFFRLGWPAMRCYRLSDFATGCCGKNQGLLMTWQTYKPGNCFPPPSANILYNGSGFHFTKKDI